MRIAVHGKEFNRQSAPLIVRVFEMLISAGAEILVSGKFSQYLKGSAFKNIRYSVYDVNDKLTDLQFFLSIGGDGSRGSSFTILLRIFAWFSSTNRLISERE